MRLFITNFIRFVLLATSVAQLSICQAALSSGNLESAKLHRAAAFKTAELASKAHGLKMSYQLGSSALADKKIQLLQSVFNHTLANDSSKNTANYYNLSTLSIIKWPILHGENLSYKHGLSENATGIKLDVPYLKESLDNGTLELTAKKHFSGEKLESTKTVTYLADFIKDALLFLGIIYILLFPIVGSIFGGMKYVQNKRNGL